MVEMRSRVQGPEKGTEKGTEEGTEKGPEEGTEKGTEEGTEEGPEGVVINSLSNVVFFSLLMFCIQINIFIQKNQFYTFEHYKSHKVLLVFKGNVADKSIKTHTKCANLNVHRCISMITQDHSVSYTFTPPHPFCARFQ